MVVPGTIGITVPISPRAISTIANSHQNASMGLVNRDPSIVNRQLAIQSAPVPQSFLTGEVSILYYILSCHSLLEPKLRIPLCPLKHQMDRSRSLSAKISANETLCSHFSQWRLPAPARRKCVV